ALIRSAEPEYKVSVSDPMVDEYMAKHAGAKKLLDRAATLEAKIAEIKRVYSKASFAKASRKERSELKSVQDELNAGRRQLSKVVGEQLRAQAQARFRNHLFQLKDRLV